MTFLRTFLLIAACTTMGTPALAQTAIPRVDLFAGYSLLPSDGEDFPRATSHGFQTAVGLRVTRWFTLAGEIGMQFSTARDLGPSFAGRVAHTRVTELVAAPRFVARSHDIDVFVHALVGIVDGDAGDGFEGFSDAGFALGGGGGLDVRLRPRLALRAQFDLIGSFADIMEGGPRFAVGLVVGFGPN